MILNRFPVTIPEGDTFTLVVDNVEYRVDVQHTYVKKGKAIVYGTILGGEVTFYCVDRNRVDYFTYKGLDYSWNSEEGCYETESADSWCTPHTCSIK
jgi:hypothetical protein